MVTPEQAIKFRRVVEANKDKKFHIFLAQIDPDAIGSSIGLKHILDELGVENCYIWYFGGVSHDQNRQIFSRFDLTRRMRPASDMEKPLNGDDVAVLVDSCTIRDVRIGSVLGTHKPLIIIDHHSGLDVTETDDTFYHVEIAGSACTLIVQLMESMGMMDLRDSEKWIATLLALGIYEDSNDLSDVGHEDVEAYAKICKEVVSFQELKRLIHYPKSRSFFKNKSQALVNMEENGSRILASVGVIGSDRGDDISTVADELIEIEGVSLVIVYGILSDTQKVRLSARSTDMSQSIDEFLRRRFVGRVGGKITDTGSGIGGGLVELDLGFWYCDYTWEEIYDLVQKRLRGLILEKFDSPEK